MSKIFNSVQPQTMSPDEGLVTRLFMPPLMFQDCLLMIGFNCLYIINNTRDRVGGNELN